MIGVAFLFLLFFLLFFVLCSCPTVHWRCKNQFSVIHAKSFEMRIEGQNFGVVMREGSQWRERENQGAAYPLLETVRDILGVGN